MALPYPELGQPMAPEDPTYRASAATLAGRSGVAPECACPGFDLALPQTPELLLGRWVRSPSKFVGWDTYMEFFGLTGDRALQETEEPQEHVILAVGADRLRILHRLPWRDGLDCEYTVPIDGTMQPIPPAMVARASSSWKVNDLASWSHAWDTGDGNPLHRGLRTEQKLTIGGVDYALRYWRSLIRRDEMRVNVEVTFVDSGKFAVHTQRFFRRIPVESEYAVACAPGRELDTLPKMATWTHNGRAVRMAVLPQAANMPTDWTSRSPEEMFDLAEPFPSAGRSAGPFLSAVRAAARDADLWVCCGVVLRGDAPASVLQGTALIGADGWLHGIHTNATPPAPFAAGTGEWPATQRARPAGVYDTQLGRLAVCAEATDALVAAVAAMGAQVVIAPPEVASGRATVAFVDPGPVHGNYTSYTLCGPEPEPSGEAAGSPLLLAGQGGGLVCKAAKVDEKAPRIGVTEDGHVHGG